MKFQIVGNPDDGFTSAELVDEGGESGEVLGRVFELEDGWYLQVNDLESLRDPALIKIALAARDELRHFINRKGASFPEGTTRADASLWLMQRDDGKGFSAPR